MGRTNSLKANLSITMGQQQAGANKSQPKFVETLDSQALCANFIKRYAKCLKDLEQAVLRKDKDAVSSCCSELSWCDRDVKQVAEGALASLLEKHFALSWQKIQTRRGQVLERLATFKEECRAQAKAVKMDSCPIS